MVSIGDSLLQFALTLRPVQTRCSEPSARWHSLSASPDRRTQIPPCFGVEGDAAAATQTADGLVPQKTPDSQRFGAEETAASEGVHTGNARPGLLAPGRATYRAHTVNLRFRELQRFGVATCG